MLFLLLLLGGVFGQREVDITDLIKGNRNVTVPPCFQPLNLAACRATTKVCADDTTKPTCLDAVGVMPSCPSCFPVTWALDKCKSNRENIPECADGVLPGIESMCPTCIPEWKPPTGCTADALKSCVLRMKASDQRPETCAADQKPEKTENCCYSCTPITLLCTMDQLQGCKDEWMALEDCATDVKPKVKTDCCRSCKPVVEKRTGDNRCTLAQIRDSLAKLEECEADEPRFTSTSDKRCGPNCRRPEDSFKIDEVVDCIKDLTECVAGVEPRHVPGSRCPVCLKPKPVCAGCALQCIRRRIKTRNSTRWIPQGDPKCVKPLMFKIRMKIKKMALRKKLKSLTAKQFTRVVIEFAERLCNRNSEADRCEKWLDVLKESLKTKRLERNSDDSEVTVELEVAFDNGGSSGDRRLLQDNEVVDFTNSALSDDSSEITILSPSDDSASPLATTVSGFVVAFLSIMLLSQ